MVREKPKEANQMNYTVSWKQVYHNWHSMVDNKVEDVLQYSDFKEALEVISKIKSTL